MSAAASHADAGVAPTRRAETALLLRIALPLVAAYLAEVAMFVTTKIVVGRLGYHELAAVGLAGELSFEVLIVLMGLLSIVGVLVAQADGAGRRRDAGHAARQGLIVATALGVPATVFVWNLAEVLALTGQDPTVVALAAPYLRALSGCVLPVL
ncbi:MAG: MATE family efflux transporter, partial [Rhodospirillales bacterium]|nr:MATE family efflux transporter [Rhodospirillales bacterium]